MSRLYLDESDIKGVRCVKCHCTTKDKRAKFFISPGVMPVGGGIFLGLCRKHSGRLGLAIMPWASKSRQLEIV